MGILEWTPDSLLPDMRKGAPHGRDRHRSAVSAQGAAVSGARRGTRICGKDIILTNRIYLKS